MLVHGLLCLNSQILHKVGCHVVYPHRFISNLYYGCCHVHYRTYHSFDIQVGGTGGGGGGALFGMWAGEEPPSQCYSAQ